MHRSVHLEHVHIRKHCVTQFMTMLSTHLQSSRAQQCKSRAGEIAPQQVRKRRTQSGLQAAPLAAEGASRARRAPPTPLAAVQPMPAAAARVRRPSRLFRTPCGPHSGCYGGRRGHATAAPGDDTANCPIAANESK